MMIESATKFKIGDIVSHTSPPYLTDVPIVDIDISFDPPRYAIDGKRRLFCDENWLRLSSFAMCKECHSTGVITLLTSTVICACRLDEENGD